MNRLRIVSLLSTLLATIACSRPQGVPQPSVSAKLAEGTLSVTVSVPARHHAYLDSGREGNLIPVTFDWKAWTESGQPEPTIVDRPEGDIDEDTGARILRGEGVFAFTVPPTARSADFRVRVQICDEIKGICYRPAWHDVTPEG